MTRKPLSPSISLCTAAAVLVVAGIAQQQQKPRDLGFTDTPHGSGNTPPELPARQASLDLAPGSERKSP